MPKIFRFALLSILIFVLFNGCKEEKQKGSPIQIEFTKEGELSILHRESDSILSTFLIEFAEDSYETQTGLMNRVSMQNNQGMLFIFPDSQPRSFYMKNTLISLDIIYIDDQMKIVSFQKNAKPMDESSLPSGTPAKYVLEINGGLSDQLQLEVGDKIIYNKN